MSHTEQLTLTPQQLKLARHALGLPNDRRMSYRNRYFASQGHASYNAWCDMATAGIATWEKVGSQTCFYLTKEGATAALEPGERLDPEDFPS